MSERFGSAALRFCCLAARTLGWRPSEFWAATPAELTAVLCPPDGDSAVGLARGDLNRLMELDNGDTWLRPD